MVKWSLDRSGARGKFVCLYACAVVAGLKQKLNNNIDRGKLERKDMHMHYETCASYVHK
jgi:hypothetical protein